MVSFSHLIQTEPVKFSDMITIISDAPDNVAAFRASGKVTKEDFENIIMPHVKAKVDRFNELNYLLHLETRIEDFTTGAWMQDALLGLKNITKWNRCAIISDQEGVHKFTEVFSKVMPGDYRAFNTGQLAKAVAWCATGEDFEF